LTAKKSGRPRGEGRPPAHLASREERRHGANVDRAIENLFVAIDANSQILP
jgi:hypothetical protein